MTNLDEESKSKMANKWQKKKKKIPEEEEREHGQGREERKEHEEEEEQVVKWEKNMKKKTFWILHRHYNKLLLPVIKTREREKRQVTMNICWKEPQPLIFTRQSIIPGV